MIILGIIPARGGSKGLPRKNLRLIHGRPLIYWTIRAAQQARILDRFMVSTEDAEIAAVASGYGAEVLDRPPHLAEDQASSRDVIRHALEVTGADISVLLQPTSPIRDDHLIDRCLTAFLAGDYDSLATGFMNLIYPPHGQEHRRQDIGQTFVNDGSVIISTRTTIMAGSLFGQKPGIMVTDREQNVDIDDEFDLWLAEKILEKRFTQTAEQLRRNRDQRSRDRHLLGIHLLMALRKATDDETAHRVAAQAFKGYTKEIWEQLLEGSGEADRSRKFFQILKEGVRTNPDSEVVAEGPGYLETRTKGCGAEEIYKKYGLTSFLKQFCDEDFELARLVSPEGALARPAVLTGGHPECQHQWRFGPGGPVGLDQE